MTPASVLRTHQKVFYQALSPSSRLECSRLVVCRRLHLVRSNGTSLSKEEVLNDLQFGGLVFRSVKLMNARVRLVGSVAVLTGESKTIAERQGIVSESHFRLIAVYVEAEGSIRLLHFQSTDMPATPQSPI